MMAALFAALALCADAAETTSVRVDGVAAYVNKNTITIADVMAAIEPVRRQLIATCKGDELKAKLRTAFDDGRQSLIEKRLILDAYAKQEARVPEWAIDQRVEELITDMFKGDRSNLMAELAKEQLTYEEWRNEVRDHMVVASMRAANVEQNVKVAPGAVRAYYEAHLSDYQTPAKVKLRMIVIKKGDTAGQDEAKRRLAVDLRDQARKGADFGALAKRSSEGSHAEEGGDWGWVQPEKDLRAELARAIQPLKPGETSDVVEISGDFYILKIESRAPSAVAPFEQVQPQVERQLRQQEGERLYHAWIQRLKANAYVQTFSVSLFE
jgi:peptidyl-prolyl cis-trans isomerase SurA